jgi:hypothetical protein
VDLEWVTDTAGAGDGGAARVNNGPPTGMYKSAKARKNATLRAHDRQAVTYYHN